MTQLHGTRLRWMIKKSLAQLRQFRETRWEFMKSEREKFCSQLSFLSFRKNLNSLMLT